MKTLVIYDSVFGNTEKIAQAMADAVGGTAKTVTSFSPADLDGVELLLVGSPTRGFRATEPMTNWLKSLPAGKLAGVKAAAFDTRISQEEINAGPFFLKWLVKWQGYAAEKISAGLTAAGAKSAGSDQGFLVHSQQGPICDGEIERATAWVKQMAI